MTASPRPSGMPYALAAYFLWGLLPLYLRLLHDVPPLEFVGWRTLFSIPVCALILLATRQTPALISALTTPRTLGALTASALLICSNWSIYVLIVQSGHLFAASLGYYINPLLNVLVGTLFLGERLSRAQWIAVALAAIGVAILALGAIQTLGWSLALAASFSAYGLVRKKAPVAALPGLTAETLILALPALALIAYGHAPGGIALGQSTPHDLLLAAAGIATAIPLLLFATAAQRMDYSLLGFVQYLAPTLVFLQGLFLFHEPLNPVQLASFILIWAALAVFSWDLWHRRKR